MEYPSFYVNFYDKLKPKFKRAYREEEYIDILTNVVVSMFKYEKSEEYSHIDDRTIELCLLQGAIGWGKLDNKLACGVADKWSGALDINGLGTSVIASTLNGKLIKGINGVDAVLGLNNPLGSPEMSIGHFASKYTECDISEDFNIKYARLKPFYIAKTNKIKETIKLFLQSLTADSTSEDVIVDDTITVTDKGAIEQVSVTDIEAISKLQYLATYRNDLDRRFYSQYGQALGEGVKLAQQSIEEINSNISKSFIIPLSMLKEREKMCAELERVFGGSISVSFSDAWDIEYSKFKERGNNNGESKELYTEA